MSSPRDFECETCGARPGSPCVRPSEHTVFASGFHAPRRAVAGLADGPIHPDRYIKPGTYAHGCGEPITLDHCGQDRASDGTRCDWDQWPCPRCKKRVWISDLGPVATLRPHAAPNDPQPSLFEEATLL